MDAQLIHFNRPETALRCAELWLAAGARRVVIWDNASAPTARATLERAVAQRADLILRCLPENLGYAGAAAAAVNCLCESDDNAVLVAAHDAEPSADAVRQLETILAQDASIGVLFPSGGGSVIGEWRPVRGRGRGSALPPLADVVDCFYAQAPCFVLSRKAVDAAVLPDPALFCYEEECDLGLQARKVGFRVVTAMQATVKNTETALSVPVPASVAYLQARNSIYLARKHSPGPAYLLRALWVATLSAVRLLDPRPRHFSLAPLPRLRGAAAGVLNRMGPPPYSQPRDATKCRDPRAGAAE